MILVQYAAGMDKAFVLNFIFDSPRVSTRGFFTRARTHGCLNVRAHAGVRARVSPIDVNKF